MTNINLVNTYLDGLSEIRKKRALEIVTYIRLNYPKATESIKYGMPAYEFNNTYIAFASQKLYFSLYTHERRIVKYISDEIPKLSTGKGCVRFKDTNEFVVEVIRKAIDKTFTEKAICTDCTIKPCTACQL